MARIARELVGKWLFSRVPGQPLTGGRIVETEAYAGWGDLASHAANGRRTRRNEMMYRRGGVAYVYLCYGMHCLLNVVTNEEGVADAVLIRALEPLVGAEHMRVRRGGAPRARRLASGPGALARAMGITLTHNGAPLTGPEIWLEDRGGLKKGEKIVAAPRVGVAYAGPDAARPWRFFLEDNAWVSKP